MQYRLRFTQTVDRVLATLPEAVAASVRPVLEPFIDPLSIERLDGPAFLLLPYWIVFPAIILTERRRSAMDGRARDALEGILQAQVCLFLSTRLHDDLFDGQRTDPSLLYAGDAFLLHAVRQYQALFPGHPAFWSLFHAALSETWRAILSADAAQRQYDSDAAGTFARDYAAINALFRIGIAAACHARRRMSMFPAWTRCADALAVAEQLLDDFEDLEQDVADGRLNAAAALLLRGVDPSAYTNSDATVAIAARLVSSGAGPAFDAIRGLHRDAGQAARDLGSARALEYIALRSEALHRIEAACHRARVEHVFGTEEEADSRRR